MSQAPSMPMYWDAYLADTTHLTCEEHGAYMLLLAAMWRRNGCVPDSDKDNARILGLTLGKWKKIKARLSNFLIIENGTISQKKLQKIWKKTQEKIAVNKSNGAKGGRPKSKENNDLEKPNGSVSVKPIETIPEPEPELTVKRDTKVSPKTAIPKTKIPDDWHPTNEGVTYAIEQGIPERLVTDEIHSFIAYWSDRSDRDSRKSERGWLQCWQGSCRRVGPRMRKDHSMVVYPKSVGHGQGGSIASIAAQRRFAGEV